MRTLCPRRQRRRARRRERPRSQVPVRPSDNAHSAHRQHVAAGRGSRRPPPLPPGPGRGAAVANARAAPVGAGEPPGSFPSIPGMNMTDVSPDRNDPFPNRSFADIVTSVEEAPTGRFMIGVGANSFQGLTGNIQIYEKNFDIFNFPRSFSDITNGQAFRGGGQ